MADATPDQFENIARDTRGNEVGLRDYARTHQKLPFLVGGEQKLVLCCSLPSAMTKLKANVRFMDKFVNFLRRPDYADLAANGVYNTFHNIFTAPWAKKEYALKMMKFVTRDGFQPADLNTAQMRELAARVAFYVSQGGQKVLPSAIFTKDSLDSLDATSNLVLVDAVADRITAIDGRSFTLEEARQLKSEMPTGGSPFYGPNPPAQATYCDLRPVLDAVQ
eukprot:COSAG02_NODE_607_length_19608_cov_33.568968_11_plen_221_part_00